MPTGKLWATFQYTSLHNAENAYLIFIGFLGSDWVGPQVLAHHILLEMTADLYLKEYHLNEQKFTLESRNCPTKSSLLYPEFFLGQQWRDKCINDKLTRSKIPFKECLHD